MNTLSRFNQSLAEDGQRSVVLNGADARLLNGLDEIAKKLQAMREDNTDTERDAYLAELQRMATDMSDNVTEGWL